MTIRYSIVRSARRRRTIEMTVTQPCQVVVAAPLETEIGRVEALISSRARWIERRGARLADAPGPRRFEDGDTLPYLGRDLPITLVQTADVAARVRLIDERLEIAVPSGFVVGEQRDAIVAALERWYRARAAERIRERLPYFAELLGVSPVGVLVRNQRHRWGSCSASGVLRFNWRIVMAPPEVMDYVLVHELAHLRVRAHAASYWALVARVIPDHRELRARLWAYGVTLDL